MEYYKQSIEEIFRDFQTSENGISQHQAAEKSRLHGPNRIADEAPINKLKILINQFVNPLIYMLIVAAVITAALNELKDAVIIIVVVFLNAIIGFFQEFKAEESIRALKSMMVPQANVMRDAKEMKIASEELVPGDIVLLESGDKVPADLRLFKINELRIDEAVLTGESIPVYKTSDPIHEDYLTPGDQTNMAFMGTLVVSGRALGVVTSIGSKTVLGGIAERVKQITSTKSPLQVKFDKFANQIGLLVIVAAILLFLLGVFTGESLRDMFMTAVAAAVAAIPEGMPIMVTIALAIGVRRMARNNAVIRKMPAVETLGGTTVICSDKTGTLTKNEMTVKLIFDGSHNYEVTGTGYDPSGDIMRDWQTVDVTEEKNLQWLLRIGLLCNEADAYKEGDQFRIHGDPTEGALVVSAMKAGLNQDTEKQHWIQIHEIPFESERGYMATLHEHQSKKYVFVKGAPENVLDMCTECMVGDPTLKNVLGNVAVNFAKEGLRVLAMAYKELPFETTHITEEDLKTGLVVAGLQGMIDPPRPEVIDAINGCRSAGIRVIMITGDHAVTALAIARQLSITDHEHAAVMTGRELERIDDEELFQRVNSVNVYARVSPEHKLRIVRQLINHGNIVAVTGDGVNDAPALKTAHIGVAMGQTGTDVSKEAADMIIVDDNFASIFAAVKEGRIVFDNIRKVTFFLIPTGVAAILSLLGTVAVSLPMPYLPAQLLWINLVTNTLQDIALAFEPGESNVTNRPPRDPNEGIMSRVMLERTFIVGVTIALGVIYTFYDAISQGASLEKARTVAMTTMVLFQFFQAWNSRSEFQSVFRLSPISNPYLIYALLAAALAQVAVIYVPVFQWVFRTEALNYNDWILIFWVSSSVLVISEIDKLIRRRRGVYA